MSPRGSEWPPPMVFCDMALSASLYGLTGDLITCPSLPSSSPPSTPCSALGNNYEDKLYQRLAAVKNEIEEKGHYNLTYEELAFGARTAWRNAPRCVNRIIWRQLEVSVCVCDAKFTWL